MNSESSADAGPGRGRLITQILPDDDAPEPDDPICDRCGRQAGRTHRIADYFHVCWPCLDRYITRKGQAKEVA